MGHMASKDVYRDLEEKIDGSWLRTPRRESFYEVLRLLYTEDEALLVARMPHGFSNLARVARVAGFSEDRAQTLLEGLADKGLVLDIRPHGETFYMPSPIVIGIFEFTMMRTGGVDHRAAARLLHDAMLGEGAFFEANFTEDAPMSVMRTLPHEEAVRPASYVEILSYEKAAELVDGFDRFGLGICSCRHKKLHLGTKECDNPLETCTSFGMAADYLIRHNMAREVSRDELLEALKISVELGLVLNSDNTRRGIWFICQCCGCCCTMLQGVGHYGYANTLVTSSFIASVNEEDCVGCGKCAKACPVNAISMVSVEDLAKPGKKPRKKAVVDKGICLGCGVCALSCKTDALGLEKRTQRVIHPETTFERVMLQTLDKGTIANQIFDDPGALSHKAMRAVVGAFFRLPPVKRALMSETLQSRFLSAVKVGAKLQGKGWLVDL